MKLIADAGSCVELTQRLVALAGLGILGEGGRLQHGAASHVPRPALSLTPSIDSAAFPARIKNGG